MAKPTPKSIVDRIVKLYQSGLSISDVKEETGVSKPTISKILKKYDITIRTDNGQSLKIDWDIVNQEYNDGASTYDLATKYNC